MLKLFRLIFSTDIRASLTLFLVLVLAGTGFLTMRELTTNVENIVALETRPYVWADMTISSRGYSEIPLIDIVRPYLTGITYEWGEKKEFSTTLFDREWKTWLIQVIAYTGKYPIYGTLKTESIGTVNSGTMISATPGIIDRFSNSWVLRIDEREIMIDSKIVESSDLGFSFSDDGNLLILPADTLSGSMLLSSGSRLDQDLLLAFPDGTIDSEALEATLKLYPELSNLRIRNFKESARETSEATDELGRYLLLILVVAVIFAGIIIRSAHSTLLDRLSRTLRILETLGLSRMRQMSLFLGLYMLIVPTAFLLSIGLSYLIVWYISTLEGAEAFVFLPWPIVFALQVFLALVVSSFLPAWSRFFDGNSQIFSRLKDNIDSLSKKIFSRATIAYVQKVWSFIRNHLSFVSGFSLLSFLSGILLILWIIFEDIAFSLLLLLGWASVLLILSILFSIIFASIFKKSLFLRMKHFYTFDGIRTLVRPLSPAIPLTISLTLLTAFLFLFVIFSLTFRERLTLDTENSANIFAINILQDDAPKISEKFPDADFYDILRARISKINGKSLETHLIAKWERPTGEFTREFNITTNTLDDIAILEGKRNITSEEVSVDDEFAKRLGVTLWDQIDFLLSGKNISLRVANIRASSRSGFSPFFYFSFNPEAFRLAPKTYFLSAYTTDTETWKKEVINASGPHVTFIDIDAVLEIARSIATKILSVISLFLLTLWVFAILALYTLFGSFWQVESIKSRLYRLFGAKSRQIALSFRTSRVVIFLLSFILSIGIWAGLFLYIVSLSSFLDFSPSWFFLSLWSILTFYIFLFFLVSWTKK
jgi:putative ABC transport system permease protein